jgi:hypothetical protein
MTVNLAPQLPAGFREIFLNAPQDRQDGIGRLGHAYL